MMSRSLFVARFPGVGPAQQSPDVPVRRRFSVMPRYSAPKIHSRTQQFGWTVDLIRTRSQLIGMALPPIG
jgi:hypothetical protein